MFLSDDAWAESEPGLAALGTMPAVPRSGATVGSSKQFRTSPDAEQLLVAGESRAPLRRAEAVSPDGDQLWELAPGVLALIRLSASWRSWSDHSSTGPSSPGTYSSL